ncbi:MarR family winged helix-turn-helix transcriptional regulator [Nocardioides sp. GXQ0305]|uniref:MarR family winged helix-turn-helix transcriptional regulator n=1 Tax=Nocardioides sp. GXQ0305 TaxID=3423912 RepID=UPI003D7CFA40
MPAPTRPPIKGTSLLFDVFVLAQAVQDMLARGMVDSPLTPGEYALYSHVGEAGPCTPTAIAHDLHVPATTVSVWVRTMSERGHVVRERSEADGRSYEIALNGAGLAAHATAREAFDVVNARFLARLTRPEPELRQALAAVIAAAAGSGGTPGDS